MSKFKPIVGMICSIDPKNKLKQDMMEPKIVCLVKRVKYRPFGFSIWDVQEVGEEVYQKPIRCTERLLYPSNMYIARTAIDTPQITMKDIQTLDSVINALSVLLYTPAGKKVPDVVKDVCALKEKLLLYKSMREV